MVRHLPSVEEPREQGWFGLVQAGAEMTLGGTNITLH